MFGKVKSEKAPKNKVILCVSSEKTTNRERKKIIHTHSQCSSECSQKKNNREINVDNDKKAVSGACEFFFFVFVCVCYISFYSFLFPFFTSYNRTFTVGKEEKCLMNISSAFDICMIRMCVCVNGVFFVPFFRIGTLRKEKS